MLKNNFSDKLSEEFLISIEKLITDDEYFSSNLETLYKKYLGFDSKTLCALPLSELNNLLVHNRIEDYSKLTILGILFVEEWLDGDVKDSYSFDKLIKGFTLLKDIFLEDKETKVDYYKPYLFKAANTLIEYETSMDLKKDLVFVFLKNNDFNKVDDLIFEILDEDSSFKTEAINVYNEMLSCENHILDASSLTKEEILDAIDDVKNY